MKNRFLILLSIVALAFALRFFKLGEVPLGFHQDEVSQAYNSYSILKTAKDRYGEFLPILFRSFGSYQPPVYTYLAPIPILLFGNTIFAARFISALFGTLVVVLTYLIAKTLIKRKYNESLPLTSASIVAISPWAIHFSRRVVEGTLGLFFFLLALYLFLLSLKKIKFFVFACLALGIATHAYYSERLIAVIFLPIFLVYFKEHFLKYKKQVFYGMLIFGLTLVPHIITVTSGAFAARFNQVSDAGNRFTVTEFSKHFVSYLSPRNLFSDIGSGLGRVSPNLGVFYGWFFIPFLAGLYFLFKAVDRRSVKLIGILTLIFLIPVSLTGDVFYPLRALEYFWVLSFIVSIGLFELGGLIKPKTFRFIVFTALMVFSIGSFYVSYFVLYQHETTENVGNTYVILSSELNKYNDYKIVLDTARDPAAGLRIAYIRKYDPVKLQSQLRSQLTTPYYSGRVNMQELYVVDNIEARPIDWKTDRCSKKTILVGDSLAFSQDQIDQHHLTKVFEIKGINKNIVLWGYETNPDKKCNISI